MSAQSWVAYRDLLAEEVRRLRDVGRAALLMTQALVANDPEKIHAVERRIEGCRLLHQQAQNNRLQMQKAGFGDLKLEQVCRYAPLPVRRHLQSLSREITIQGVSLAITIDNNRSLILAGLQRIRKSVELIQASMTEQPGTYRRRGYVAKPAGSVIVSRNA